ncbi:hypothetical protein WME89_47835 [Sorangium sp. So ce321]|uniref:hypothetical protein n=1 Tax=Sorangium sp. So ce321 TaxID=3133300 RepID=UPI003F608CBF
MTPLGVIATFVMLSEVVAGVAATQTSGMVQVAFCSFAIAFPLLVATAFFMILWRRPYVLYPPQEFGAQVDVKNYVEAMRAQTLGTQEVITLVRTSITEALESREAREALLRSSAAASSAASATALHEASDALIRRAVQSIQATTVGVDLSEFGGTTEMIVPYDQSQESFVFINAIYYQISHQVPPYTYGQSWGLQESDSGAIVLPSRADWRTSHIGDMGIKAGMRYRAVALSIDPSTRKLRATKTSLTRQPSQPGSPVPAPPPKHGRKLPPSAAEP